MGASLPLRLGISSDSGGLRGIPNGGFSGCAGLGGDFGVGASFLIGAPQTTQYPLPSGISDPHRSQITAYSHLWVIDSQARQNPGVF
jgi:hypothetical protein